MRQFDPHDRLNGIKPSPQVFSNCKPDFNNFFYELKNGGDVPCETAFAFLLDHLPWLNVDQLAHLRTSLSQSRDIYHSQTLPAHQETVLCSDMFHNH